jgi:hypothetical protein
MKNETKNELKTNEAGELFVYHLFPPFIDAYQNSFWFEPRKR